jgi:hypothetical protein
MDGKQPTGGSKATETSRGRSTIEFPYLDQDDAADVTRAVHTVGGTSCSWEQLAAQLKQAAKGGGFRMRVTTARMFGLLEYDRGRVLLTDLGSEIIDPKREKHARAESFLTVPLYRATYEKLKGSVLPPNQAIENTMENLGVAPKQKDKARQVFMRSAKSAGFFDIDAQRLTYPPINGGGTANLAEASEALAAPRVANESQKRELHPFIQGLLDKLPPPDSTWSTQGRIKWLQASANIFDLIYLTDSEGQDEEIFISRKTS